MMIVRLLVATVVLVVFSSVPVAAQVPTPIAGVEKLAWSMPATPYLPTSLTYAVYVDGTRSPLVATCVAPVAPATAFDCIAPLPAMTPGTHDLQITAIVTDGPTTVESVKSVILSVRIVVAPPTPINPNIKRP